MGRLGDAKILGGVGSILLLIPGVNIVGYILILVASKYVSDELGDKSIFDDMLYAVIAGIVGVAAAAFIIYSGLIFGAFTLSASAVAGLVVGLLVAWLALIVSSIFIRRAYRKMGERLSIGSFRTAGTLYFVGAILVVIFVGFIVLFIAAIFQIIAFFSINDSRVAMAGPAPPPSAAAPAPPGMRACAYCGTQMSQSAAFCPKCGAKQST